MSLEPLEDRALLSATIDLTIDADPDTNTWQAFAEVSDPDGGGGIASFSYRVIASDGLIFSVVSISPTASTFPLFHDFTVISALEFGAQGSQDTVTPGVLDQSIGIGGPFLLAEGSYLGTSGMLSIVDSGSGANPGFVVFTDTMGSDTEFAGTVNPGEDVVRDTTVQLSIDVDPDANTWQAFAEVSDPDGGEGIASFSIDVVGAGGLTVTDTTVLEVDAAFPLFRSTGTSGVDIHAAQDTIGAGIGFTPDPSVGIGSRVLLASGEFTGTAGTLTVSGHSSGGNDGLVLFDNDVDLDTEFATTVLPDTATLVDTTVQLSIEADPNTNTWQAFAEIPQPGDTDGLASFNFNVTGSDGLTVDENSTVNSEFGFFSSGGSFGQDIFGSQDTLSNGGEGDGVDADLGVGSKVLLASGTYTGTDGRLSVTPILDGFNPGAVLLSDPPAMGVVIDTEFADTVLAGFVDIATSAPQVEYLLDVDLENLTWEVSAQVNNPGIATGLASFRFDVIGTGDVFVENNTTLQNQGTFNLNLESSGNDGIDIFDSQNTFDFNDVTSGVGIGGPVVLATGTFTGNTGSLSVVDHPQGSNPGATLLRGPVSGDPVDVFFATEVVGDSTSFAIGPPEIALSGSVGAENDGQDQRMFWDVNQANPSLVTTVLKRNGSIIDTSSGLSGSHDFNAAGLGVYELTVTATDDLGRSVMESRSVTVTDDDIIGPTITQGGSLGSETESQTQSFSWSTADPSGVGSTTVVVTQNGTPILESTANSGSFNFDAFGLGTFVLDVRSTDADLDWGADPRTTETMRTVTVMEDAVPLPPVVDLTGSEGAQDDGQLQEFGWSVTDGDGNLDTVSVSVTQDGSEVHSSSDVSGTFNFDALGLGDFSIEVTGTDALGAMTTETRSVTVTDDDDVAPSIVLGGSVGTESDALTQEFSWDASDASGLASVSVSITKDGSEIHSSTDESGSFNFDAEGVGDFLITVDAVDGDDDFAGDSLANSASRSVSVIPAAASTLQVNSFDVTPSGVVVNFNRDVDFTDVNLYPGLSDVILRGSNGDIAGSLIPGATPDSMTFVQTGGVLPADDYLLVVRSGEDAFKNTDVGLLDGNRDGTPGDSFADTFTVDAAASPVLSVPDFARGPGQDVNVPAVGSGFPVSISSATGVLSFDFTLNFDAGLLDVTGTSPGAGLPADWALASTISAGQLEVSAFGTTPISGSDVQLVDILASVPTDASYGASQLLDFSGVAVTGDASDADTVGEHAIHQASFLGDVDGDGMFSGHDAALIAGVVVGNSTGFEAAPLVDPVILGNVTGSGQLTGLDASRVAQESVGLDRPEIPNIPAPAMAPASDAIFADDSLEDADEEEDDWAGAVDAALAG